MARPFTALMYRGIKVYSSLKGATQEATVLKKAYGKLTFIVRDIEYKSEEVMLHLYKSLVWPYLVHLALGWSTSTPASQPASMQCNSPTAVLFTQQQVHSGPQDPSEGDFRVRRLNGIGVWE